MKTITIFILLLLSLFSCVKEKDYPVQFSYDYSVLSFIDVEEHRAILGDTSLDIYGYHPDGNIHIHIPRAPGHSLTVGDFTTDLNTGFAMYFTSSLGITTKAKKANLTLSHINSFVDFTFEAELYSGITLKNGIATNLPIVTEAYFNSVDSNGIPGVIVSGIDTLTNGLYAELDDPKKPFYQASKDITKAETDTSYQYRANSGNFVVEFEIMKPLELLIDEAVDITQNNQSLVLMQWRDVSIPIGSNVLTLNSGSFKLFSVNPVTKSLEFGFSGELNHPSYLKPIPIHVGYGKEI